MALTEIQQEVLKHGARGVHVRQNEWVWVLDEVNVTRTVGVLRKKGLLDTMIDSKTGVVSASEKGRQLLNRQNYRKEEMVYD